MMVLMNKCFIFHFILGRGHIRLKSLLLNLVINEKVVILIHIAKNKIGSYIIETLKFAHLLKSE